MKWSIPIVLKIVTSVFIVPVGFLLHMIWPWWEKKKLGPAKILAGIFVVPLWGIMFFGGEWWDSL